MDTIIRSILRATVAGVLAAGLVLPVTPAAVHAQPQTRPDAATLPQPPQPAPSLGLVEIERLDAPGIAVAQDQQGFMWFAGLDGLYRYDGYDFIHYQHDAQDSTTLSSKWLESLYVDRNGTLWVGTHGGLDRFEAATETFRHYQHDPGDPTSLSHSYVTVILEDHNGTFWVGTHGGLNRFDREAGTFTHYRHDPNDPTSLSNDQVRVLYEDRQGTLWVGTGSPQPFETPVGEGGLNRFDPTTGTFTRYLHDPEDETSLIHNQVMSLYEDSRGVFYVGTRGDGLHTMDRATGTFTRHTYDPSDPTKLSRPFLTGTQVEEGCEGFGCGGVSFIHEDRQGMLWIGGFDGGINRYDPSAGSGQAVETGAMSHQEAATSGLVDNQIWTLFESDDGTLWVGTWSGVHKVVSSVNAFPHYAPDPTDPNSLVGPVVTAFQEDRDGMLWIGTWSGLDRLDRSTGVFTHFSTGVESLYEDRAGALWIGHSGGEGLSRYDRCTGRFTRFRHDPNDPTSLNPGDVWALLEDRQGRFWVGTAGRGLDQFDRATGVATHHRHAPNDPGSLSDDVVTALYEDEAGTLWIGSENGLNRLVEGPEASAFTAYLSGRAVTSIYEDRARRFWVGTWGDGLYRFDRETGASTRYGPEQGLASANVAGLVEDDDGYLWISTADGALRLPAVQGWLSRLDPEAGTFTNFDAQNGLPEIGFRFGNAIKSRDGTLFFGGNGGFTAFDPARIRERAHQPPKMALTGLRVFNDEVTPGLEAPLKQPIHRAEEIRLSYAQNDFTINYAALTFRDPGQVQYHYLLAPHDADWVSARTQRSARYSGLAPGSYVFRVRAVDSRGLWSEEAASIRVVVLPPWWRTTWAYLLYGLLFLAGVFAVDRIQRRRLLRRERERTMQRELEQAREIECAYGQLEQAHTELEQTHQHLKATQNQLIQQEKMASLGQMTAGIAHEIKNPLNFVNNFSELSVELADDLEAALANGQDVDVLLSHLKRNAASINHHGRRADAIVQSMMQHASGGTGERRMTDVNVLVEEYVNLAYHGMRAQRLDFNVKIEREYGEGVGSVAMVPQEMGRVLLNLLSNAFYAVDEKADAEKGEDRDAGTPRQVGAGSGRGDAETGFEPTVTVATRRHGETVEIRVSDNGPGIHKELSEKIFEPFYTTKPTGGGNTGLGLSLSYEIVVQGHRGTLEVESTEGAGATFIVTLPA